VTFPLARWLLAVSVLAAGATGCSSNQGDAVAVVGDSITSFDKPALRDDLRPRYETTIVGDFGATVAEVMPAARLVARKNLDQVIINLGTNDVIGQLDLDRSVSDLGSMIDLFGGVDCIHVVTINEHMVNKQTGELLQAEAEKFNSGLRDLADRRDRVDVIDWNGVVEETLAGNPPTSTLTKDSTHPTKEGNARLNELYMNALESC
jgi:lysophospholipase L1-like esterase